MSRGQLKKLTPGEIEILKDAGYDVHAEKGPKKTSRFDLYKDPQGDIYQLLKGGKGEPENLRININRSRRDSKITWRS